MPCRRFQSTRLSRASTQKLRHQKLRHQFQSTRLLRASTKRSESKSKINANFNPQGSREPRRGAVAVSSIGVIFQSTRLSRASTYTALCGQWQTYGFQSTRLSRASTRGCKAVSKCERDFNPQGSREPRLARAQDKVRPLQDFNPQGSREPRLNASIISVCCLYFNPQGSREPRHLLHGS